MKRYRKGANAERELIKVLAGKQYSILRSAGSGVNPLPCPDIIALKDGRAMAFECKAWNASYLNVPMEQFESTLQWCSNAGAVFFIAWKIPNKGWLFLPPKVFKKTPKHYVISLKKARVKALNLDRILGLQAGLKNNK